MSLLGTAVKVGSSLFGGLLGKKSQDKNVKLQKQFAKNAIQWKAQDALKAGIHPLYALGANTTSFSPVSVGGTGSPMGNALADMGQDVGRAIEAGGNAEDRVMRKFALERAGLENDLLRSQIAREKSQLGPPSPVGAKSVIPGQEQSVNILGRNLALPPGTDPANVAQNLYGEGGELMYYPILFANLLFGKGGIFEDSSRFRSADIQRYRPLIDWWKSRAAIGRKRMESWK